MSLEIITMVFSITLNITGVFNVQPQTIKLFKTISLESDDCLGGNRTLETDLSEMGDMLSTYFEQKEGEWFSFIRNKSTNCKF